MVGQAPLWLYQVWWNLPHWFLSYVCVNLILNPLPLPFSDSIPLFGYRRRSYLFLSGLLGAFSWSLMATVVSSKYSAASSILLGSLSVAFSDVVSAKCKPNILLSTSTYLRLSFILIISNIKWFIFHLFRSLLFSIHWSDNMHQLFHVSFSIVISMLVIS